MRKKPRVITLIGGPKKPLQSGLNVTLLQFGKLVIYGEVLVLANSQEDYLVDEVLNRVIEQFFVFEPVV